MNHDTLWTCVSACGSVDCEPDRDGEEKNKNKNLGEKETNDQGGREGESQQREPFYTALISTPPHDQRTEEQKRRRSSTPVTLKVLISLTVCWRKEKKRKKKNNNFCGLWQVLGPDSLVLWFWDRIHLSGCPEIWGTTSESVTIRYVSVLWKAVHKKPHHTTVTWCVQGRSSLVLPTWWLICRWERGLKLTLF